jgi:hypothetical protein
MDAWGDWQPGPAGQDAVPGSAQQWTYLDTRPLRRAAQVVMWSALAALAGMIALTALIAMLIPHAVLIAVLIVLGVPVVLLTLATAFLIWVGRRAWRTGAWLELVPMASGMPWSRRLIWAVRTLLVSRAFWRLGRRARRFRGATAEYQAYPGGPWRQARAGDLSGTTR